MNTLFRRRRIDLTQAGVFCCLLAVVGIASDTLAGDPSTVADDVAMVRPFIGETTSLVVKVDPARLALPDLSKTLTPIFPDAADKYEAMAEQATRTIEMFRAATDGQSVYATVGIPISKDEWPLFLFLKDTPDVNRQLLLGFTKEIQELKSGVPQGTIAAKPHHASLDRNPSSREELAEAFEAVKSYPVQVLLLPPDYVRRTVTEMVPELPDEMGGGPCDVLTEGLVWAALGVDPGRLRAELIIQSASEEVAQELAKHVPKMLRSGYDANRDLKREMPRIGLEALVLLLAPKVEGDRLALRLDGHGPAGQTLQLVATVVGSLQRQVGRHENIDKFKQILLGMHNYHDTHKAFPPPDKARDETGKSKLSWRVHILPFIEENRLYKEFHLDEPWDSEHNKKLIERMPNGYKSRGTDIKPGHTTFLAPVGEDTVLGGEKATPISRILDGTSNTVMLVEVKPELAVPWTAPLDYAFDPEAPASGLQGGPEGRLLAAFADGSVHQLRGNLEAKILLLLFQKSDGQPIPDKGLH